MSDTSLFPHHPIAGNHPNDVYPQRGAYQQQPHPDDVYQPSSVVARSVKTDGTAAEQAHATMLHAAKEFQKHIEKTDQDRHRYTSEGQREQLAMFKTTDAAKAVDKAVEQVKARHDEAQAQMDTVRRSLSKPGDAAQESRNSRYWARTKSVLDTLKPAELLVAAEDLLAKADRAELSVLAEELTSYLKSRGSIAELTDKKTGETRNLIDGALARVVPEYADAHARLKKANAAMLFTESAAKHLKSSFESGTPANTKILNMLNPNTAGRLPTDRRGTLPESNGGKYDPDR